MQSVKYALHVHVDIRLKYYSEYGSTHDPYIHQHVQVSYPWHEHHAYHYKAYQNFNRL